ncbi:MAG: hypothetical protein JWM16_1944 [Verrucomicrobiales bacterium]|nr:hypothetical protein [Verrucomicrobiales bacterium]
MMLSRPRQICRSIPLALFLFWVLADAFSPSDVALGCGPFFPNTLLNVGDRAMLTAPEVSFQAEIERMKLIGPVFSARPATNLALQSLQADLDDLTAALGKAGLPADTREAIMQQHQAERRKIDVSTDSLRPTNAARFSGELPRIVPGLPGEFADYFRGAVAWHQNKLEDPRAAWMRVLERPAAERRYKSTWAAFMLARSWEEENPSRAISYFQQVRTLAKAGFVDSLGLATSSLGFEARLHLRAQRFAEAIDLYLQQASEGDASAINSLRYAASHALERGNPVLRPLASHPRAQRVVTAYVIAGGWRSAPIDIDSSLKEAALLLQEKAAAKSSFLPAPNPAWHTKKEPVLIWLEAVEAAKVKDVDSAEQLALAAYQAGRMEEARRWLARALPTPAMQWLRAKLLLRDGKVEAAGEILARLCHSFPLESGRRGVKNESLTVYLPPPAGSDPTNGSRRPSLADSMYVSDGDFSIIPAAYQMRGELGVFYLARRQYAEALQTLLQSGYWLDAAYVAEDVLTLDELKTSVDRNWPPAMNEDAKLPRHSVDGAPDDERVRAYQNRRDIRYLLARRLVRANQTKEAEGYFPEELLGSYRELRAMLETGENPKLPLEKRAEGYFEAAKITREQGLELVGTEAGPDWQFYSGNFESSLTATDRMSMSSSNLLAASTSELERAQGNAPTPNVRWHYRRTASALAVKGAKIMRSAEMIGLSREEKASALLGSAQAIHAFDGYAAETPGRPGAKGEELLECFPSAILAWKAAQLLPNNQDETARALCMGGSWIKNIDPNAADIFYKALVRRCRKTAMGNEADRLRWFPVLDEQGNMKGKSSPAVEGKEKPEAEH